MVVYAEIVTIQIHPIEPHAENADEGAVAVRAEGEFVHAKNVA